MERNCKLVLLLLAACAVFHGATAVLYDPGTLEVNPELASDWDKFNGVFVFAGRNITTTTRARSRACLVLSEQYDRINTATNLPATRDEPAICPLFAGYDSEVKHTIYFRRGIKDQNADVATQIEQELNSLLTNFNTPQVQLTDMLMYTWVEISTGCNDASCKNTFQMVVAIAGTSTYLIFNYEKISAAGFSTSPTSYSLAGINLGDYQGFEHLPFSNRPLETIRRLTDYGTTEVKGRYFYRISTHKPQRLGCLDMSSLYQTVGVQPLTLSTYNMDIYGGYRLLVQGPCFNLVSDKISCAFSRRSSQGLQTWENSTLYRLDNYTGVCLSPRTPKVDLGWTTVGVSLTNDNNWHYSTPAYIAAPSDNEMPVRLNGDKAIWLSVNPTSRVSFSWTSSVFGNVPTATPVQYLIVGYKNVSGNVEAVEFPTFSVSGTPTTTLVAQEIELKNIQCTERCEGVAIGQIVVRLATGIQNTTATRHEISSPIIPIGWYTYHSNDASRISQLCKDNLGHHMEPLSCPCNSRVVLADPGKFIPAPDCGSDGRNCFYSDANVECYVTMPHNGAGLRCCYTTTGGHLVYGQDNSKQGSYTTQYAPLTGSLQQNGTTATVSYLLSHIVPYAACCVWPKEESKECYLYGVHHAVDVNCTEYSVSGVSAIVGDPHFITPDAGILSFNSDGEFWFLKPTSSASDLSRIQVRLTKNFGPSSTPNSGPQPMTATVLTAIVLAQGNNKLEIQMRTRSLQQTKKLHLYYNGKEIIFFDIKEQVYPGMRITTQGADQSFIHAMSTNDGTAIQCRFESIDGFSQMRCTVYVQASLKNHTSGLIGNWNDNATDDLVKQGSIEAFPLTNLSMVHEVGLTWQIKADESLFTYIYTTYNDNLPTLRPVVAYTQNDQLCASSMDVAKQSCSYDLNVTRSVQFAQNTRGVSEGTLNTRNQLHDTRNTEYCPFLNIDAATKTFSNGHQKNSEASTNGCKNGYQLVGSRSKFTCNGTAWIPAPTAICSEVAVADASTDMLVVIIVCSVIGGLLLIGLIVGGIIYWKKKSKKNDDDDDNEDGKTNEAVKMDSIDSKADPGKGQQQVVYGQQPTYGQQKIYGEGQQRTYGEGQQKVYGEGQQKVYGEGQQKVYGEGQQKVYGDTQQKVYGDAKQPDSRQNYDYGQYPKPPPRSDDYGKLPTAPPRSDYAPPVAPRQQPGYGGVRVLPATNFAQPQAPAKAQNDSDSSESDEESDNGGQGNGSDDV